MMPVSVKFKRKSFRSTSIFLLFVSLLMVGSLWVQTGPSMAQELGSPQLDQIEEINTAIQQTGARWVAGETSVSAPCPAPGKPASVSLASGATGVSTSPTLSWAASSNADSYDVYFGTTSRPPLVGNTTGTRYPQSGLIHNKTYYWKVVAKNNCGKSTSGSVRRFTTVSTSCPKPGTPAVISPLNGRTGASLSPTLSWVASSNADSYDVYFGSTSSPSFAGNTTGTSYPRSGLNYSATYYWKVVAKNSCGSSTSGSLWRFTTAPCPAPGTPSKPSPVIAAAGVSINPTLSWTGATSDSYDVYFGTSSNPPLVTTTRSASYSPSGLMYNRIYYWRIVAKNSCNKSTTGYRWYFRTTPGSSDMTAPSVPGGVTATAASCSQINLSWSASTDTGGSGLKGYNVYLNGAYLTQVLAPLTSTSDTGRAASTVYSYTVSAIDNAGNESTKSSAMSATTPACADTTAPSIPAGLTASAASCSQINLSWSGSSDTGGSGLKGYNVYRNGSYLKQMLSPSTLTSDTGLAASTVYSYKVSAVDNAGNQSAQSNTASTNTPACADSPPTVPTGLTATAVSSSQINLTWTASTDTDATGVAGYKVYRASSQIGAATVTSYSNPGLAASTQYCYTVAAYDTAGNTSAQSAQACATTQAGSLPGAFQWSHNFVNTDRAYGQSVAVDKNTGNVYIVGRFKGTLDFGGGAVTSSGTDISDNDIYIAAYSSSGGYRWAKSFGNGKFNNFYGVAVDSNGNVFVTGEIAYSLDFGNGPLSGLSLAKFSSSGLPIWSKSFGYNNIASGYGITVDANDDLLIAGHFNRTIDFGGGPLVSYLDGSDTFVAKFSGTDGKYLWAKSFLNNDTDYAYSIATDAKGDIFVTGSYKGTINFGGNDLMSAGLYDIFLAKLSGANGAHLWSKGFGSIGNDHGLGITVDLSNNIFLSGNFAQTVDFGNGSIVRGGEVGLYLAKFTGLDGSNLWSKGFSCTGCGCGGDRLAVDKYTNDIVMTGMARGTIDFGGGSFSMPTPSIIIVKYTSTGSHLWSKKFGAPNYMAGGTGVAIDGYGNALVTGQFQGTVNFGGGPQTSADGITQIDDIFLVKFGQ